MSQDLFSSSPMGGSQAPYKELNQEYAPQFQQSQPNVGQPVNPLSQSTQNPATNLPKSQKSKKLFLIIGGIVGFFIIILLVLILIKLSQSPRQQVIVVKETPQPTATAEVVNSSLPDSLVKQVEQLETDINNVDLQELEMSYPELDWKIRY